MQTLLNNLKGSFPQELVSEELKELEREEIIDQESNEGSMYGEDQFQKYFIPCNCFRISTHFSNMFLKWFKILIQRDNEINHKLKELDKIKGLQHDLSK